MTVEAEPSSDRYGSWLFAGRVSYMTSFPVLSQPQQHCCGALNEAGLVVSRGFCCSYTTADCNRDSFDSDPTIVLVMCNCISEVRQLKFR